jgi:biopolymer transport protein ExbB
MEVTLHQMVQTWTSGGWVMAALAVLALIMYGTAAHLLLFLRHLGRLRVTDAQLGAWVAQPEAAPRPIRELIRYTQDEVRSLPDLEGRFREIEATLVPEADRRLAFLKVLAVASPLFGLLGTVLGMLLTFKAIGVGGSSTSEIIAKGISEALVATQTGMMVALPGLMAGHVAKRWRNELLALHARLEGISLRHYRSVFRPATSPLARPDIVDARPVPALA